jgi:hypothetical protein
MKSYRCPTAFLILLLIVLFPVFLDDPAYKPAPGKKTAPVAQAAGAAPPLERTLALAEQKKAVACIDYYNRASSTLAEAPYALPGLCQTAAREYLRSWSLKTVPGLETAAPRELAAAAGLLAPPAGLFDEGTAARITQNIANMGQSLQDVLKEFRILQKYVKDDSVADDGVLGKKIISRLDAACQKFMISRDDLLKTAEESSARAEDLLLEAHPLKRQIDLSRKIFSLFKQCALLLGQEFLDRTALGQLGDKLEAVLTEAGKPPFRGPPALEREYRAFLRETKTFAEEFSLGLSLNFNAQIRQNLNMAISASRAAYKNFAVAVNRQ